MAEDACFLCLKQTENKCNHCKLVSFCCDSHRNVHRPADKCFPFKIKQSKDKGRYMVASRDIAALEIILVEKAAACGPKLSHTPVCVECFSEIDVDSYVPCNLCGLPFCSEKCRKSRELHTKSECQIFSKNKISSCDLDENSGVLASVTAMRLLNLRKNSPEVFERVDMLMDNMDYIRNSKDFSIQQKCVEFLTEKCGVKKFSPDEIHRALGIFASNSCNMSGFRARGLFPTFSLINHSCVRNARHIISSEERTMEIIAQCDIKKGEEIHVRYTSDVLDHMSSRLESIQSQWHFTCTCVRCSDRTELGTYSSAMVCRNCKEGSVLPGEKINDSPWRCSKCELDYKESLVDNTIKKLKISLEKIPKDDVDKLEAFLKISSKILHPNHCILIELKQRILQLYGTSLNPELISRKLELADQIMRVMEKLDPGITAWKGKLLYDVTRFRIVMCLQDLQSRKLSPEKVINQLTVSVSQLEMAVSGLTGEKFGDKSATLRQRIMLLGGAHILGDGYKMLLGTCLKMPFIK